MAELIHAKFLSWRHLHLLEDPFFAKSDVESAVNIHKSRGMARNRGISNFQSWLDRTSMPLGELTYEVMDSLKNGTSYYVHRHTEKPRRPLLFWKSTESKSDSFFGINGGWEVHDYVAPPLRNKLRILLSRIEPPKPVVIRKAPSNAPTPVKEEKKEAVIEKLITIRKIAAKLEDIEMEFGYEKARHLASLIGYEGISELSEVGHIQNDPNLMATRFMLLPGASDKILKSKNNLNHYPNPLHPDSPQQLSIFNMKKFLTLSSHLSDDKPYWQSHDLLSQIELDDLYELGGLDTNEVSERDQLSEFDASLEGAFNSYLGQLSSSAPKNASTHTVVEGDTLSSIAIKYEFDSWGPIWDANKDQLENPNLIYPGQVLEIPDMTDTELEAWFNTFDNGANAWSGSSHYRYPANYFSLTITNRKNEAVNAKMDEMFQAYLNDSKHRFYSLKVKKSDQVGVLLPDTNQVAVGFRSDAYLSGNVELISHERALNPNPEKLNPVFDMEDEDNLAPSDYPVIEV
ncbi:MAG: LysM peptidoglycan-binding domain-containing protein [Oleispira sp.]